MDAGDLAAIEREFEAAPRAEAEVELDRTVTGEYASSEHTISVTTFTVRAVAWAPVPGDAAWRLQMRTYVETSGVAGVHGSIGDRSLVGTELLATGAGAGSSRTAAALLRLWSRVLAPRG